MDSRHVLERPAQAQRAARRAPAPPSILIGRGTPGFNPCVGKSGWMLGSEGAEELINKEVRLLIGYLKDSVIS